MWDDLVVVDPVFDHLVVTACQDARETITDDASNEVAPAQEEIPGLAGIPGLSLSVIALHLMTFVNDNREAWNSLEFLRRIRNVPQWQACP